MESKMQQTTSLSYLLSTSSQFAYEHWEISKILFLFWEMPPFTQQAKSVYTVNDSLHILVRFLGLDVSPVRRSWHSSGAFCACGWLLSLGNLLFVIPFMHIDKHVPCFILEFLQRLRWTRPPSRLDPEHLILLLQFDLRLCPLLQKIIPELQSTVPFCFYQFILETEIMWRWFLCKRRKKSFAEAEGFVVVTANLGKYTWFVFVMPSSALQSELW